MERAEYELIGFTEEIEGHPYRLIVIKSSKTVKSIENKLENEKNDLIGLVEKAFPKNFKCLPDAEEAVKHFQKTKKTSHFKLLFDIIPIKEEKKYRGPKPKNGREIEYFITYKVVLRDIKPDTARIEALKRKEESFVLITNVSEDELSDRGVLIRYKDQGIVERSFSRLKRPMMVDTIFLKTPERIESLMSLVYVALLFQSIIQAMGRYRSSKQDNLPKIKYAKRALDNPTYELFRYLLEPFTVITRNSSLELSCNVPEMEDYLDLILYLIDAEEC